MWFMHDTHLGRAFLFLHSLAGYALLSMTIMVAACLWYVVGMKLVMPSVKFPQVGAEFWEGDATKQKSMKRSAFSLNGFQAFSE